MTSCDVPLEAFAALVEALELENAAPAVPADYVDTLDRVGNIPLLRNSAERALGNETGPKCADRT